MVPDATKWVVDTLSLVAVIGLIIALAVWVTSKSRRG
jgi:hypothetical protein